MYKVKMGRAPRYIEELFLTQELPYDMRDNDRYVQPNYKGVLDTLGLVVEKITN